MELNFILSLLVFVCYLIVMKLYFIASSMLMCYFIVMVCLEQEKTKKKRKRKRDLCMVFFLSRVFWSL